MKKMDTGYDTFTVRGDAWLVSVVEVEGSSGVPEVERGWTTEYLVGRSEPIADAAEYCALAWYRETDQCTECKVSLQMVLQPAGGPGPDPKPDEQPCSVVVDVELRPSVVADCTLVQEAAS